MDNGIIILNLHCSVSVEEVSGYRSIECKNEI
jgi:hypothetical protein